MYQTGYFANAHRGWQTHLLKYGKPVCGYRPSPHLTFQICTDFLYLNTIECPRCLKRAEKIIKDGGK